MSNTEAAPPPPRGDGRTVRLVARLLLAVLLVGGPIVGGLVALDLLQVRSSLNAARSELREVRSALGDLDLDRAADAVQAADAELATARARTETLRWSVAAVLPVGGRSIDVARDVVEVGSAALQLADLVLADGEQLLAGGLDIEVSDGRIDLTPLLATQELVAGLPIDRLADARDELAAPRNGWIPQQLLDGRDESLALADEALEAAGRAQALTTALPGFLGSEGPRRYFVGIQTSAELRGTGGLIGYFGILGIDDGTITFGAGESFEPAQQIAAVEGEDARTAEISALDGPLDQPVPTDPAFAARYSYINAASDFSNVNVHADLPTTARVALDLYRQRTGEALDGMILLDPVGVEALLRVTGGQLALPEDVAASLGLEDGLPTDRFAQVATVDVYEQLGADRSTERRAALRALGDAAFVQVVAGGWSGVDMIRAVAEVAASRNLQVFSEAPAEQAAFGDIGVTGALPDPADATADTLALIANNVVGGKQDVHLGHAFDLDVQLGEVRRADDGTLSAARTSTLQVTVDNPLPAAGMDEYIIGSCYRRGEPSTVCFQGDPGWNWTWFAAFLPGGTAPTDIRTDAVSPPPSDFGDHVGFRVVDHFQGTPPQSQASFELDATGRIPLQREPDAVVYELLWWRQSKAIPDLLDITVQPPDGWAISDVEVIGGGTGRGSGVHGGGAALEAQVVDGAAQLTGTVTADTRLRVHLVGA